MPIIPLITAADAPLSVRHLFASGSADPLTASLAHVPEVVKVALPFIGGVLGPSSIDGRTKEIVILRASAMQRCVFCTRTHTVVALDAGLGLDEVRALRGELDPAEVFTDPRERALIAWTDTVALGPEAIDPGAREAFLAHFPPHEVVEITLLAGATVMLNRYATALDLPAAPAHIERLGALGMS